MTAITCVTILLLVLSLTALSSSANNTFKIIQTEYGAIRGKMMATMFDDKSYYSYRGIPFARSPVNELRFKIPVPPILWSNVLDAFEYGNQCVQFNGHTHKVFGSEDCLYLNVFTPVSKSTKKLPVMIFVHGGGYVTGSSNEYRPDFLVNSDDVVIVTTNYRIGAFGFLSLGTANYSGNNGLKDQLFALQWVQRNIEQFGGDKNLVTLFGQSAGSSSVHFHVLSPKSEGLFKRAIMQSASATNPKAAYTKSDHLEIIYDLANKFGHDPQGIDDLIKFLHRVDSNMFVQATHLEFYAVNSSRKDAEQIWGPIAEVDVATDAFLTKHPQEYLDDRSDNQSIDTLFGFCADEMILRTGTEIFNPAILELFNEKLEFHFPRSDLRNDYNSPDNPKMTKEILDYYFSESNGKITNDTAMRFNDLMSDIWYIYGIDQALKSQVQRTAGNVFYYVFSLKTDIGVIKAGSVYNAPENFTAVSHGDDLFYLFPFDLLGDNIYKNLTENSIERKSIKVVTKLWTNFAKYGNPTPNANPVIFKPVKAESINFVNITNNGLISGAQPFADRIEFWNEFYEKYEEILRPSRINSYSKL